MATPRSPRDDSGSGASSIAGRTFATTRRGFDPDEVRAFLRALAGDLEAAQRREAELRAALDAAEQRLATPAELDDDTLLARLGEESARLLVTARESAAQIRARAEEGMERILRDAQADAARLREETELESARRREEAEQDVRAAQAVAETIRRDGESAAAAMREQARQDGVQEVEAAKARGREILIEAHALRERVLDDLARKRRTLRAQIEMLTSGRDRLLASYEAVRVTLGEVTTELIDATDHPIADRDDTTLSTGEIERIPRPVLDEERATGMPVSPGADAVAGEAAADDVAVGPEPMAERAEHGEHGDVVEVTKVRSVYHLGELVEAPPEIARREAKQAEERTDSAETSSAPAGPSIDDLFAKLRAARAGAVANAQVVLSSEATGAPSSTAADTTTVEPSPSTDATVIDLTDTAIAAGDRRSERGGQGPHAQIDDGRPVRGAAPAGDGGSDFAVSANAIGTALALSPSAIALFEQRTRLLAPIENGVVRQVKRAMADEQSQVLDRLRRRTNVKEIEDLLDTLVEQKERYREALSTWLLQAAQAGATAVMAHGPRSETATPEIEAPDSDDIDDLVTAALDEVVDGIRGGVQRAISGALGESTEVAEIVRAVYRDWKTQNVEPGLHDAVFGAFGRGSYLALPHNASVCWFVAPDESGCPDAEDNCLAGVVVKGEPFPTGHLHAPAHPGCRCQVALSDQ